MFRLTAIVLSTILCLPAAEVTKPDIRTIAREIPTGVPVLIKTTSKQSIQGKLANITAEGVTLQVVEKGQINDRTVPFSDMKSIKQTNKPMGGAKSALITLAVLYAFGALLSLAIGG